MKLITTTSLTTLVTLLLPIAPTSSSAFSVSSPTRSTRLHSHERKQEWTNIPRGGGFAAPSLPRKTTTTTRLSMSAGTAALEPTGGDSGGVGGGTATIPNEIFNLVKNIVGAGVLGLSAGIAAFGSAPSAVLPASILIAIIGALSGYCFSLIGRVCAYTGAETYRAAWDKTVGTSSSWIPAASVTAKTCLAVLAYSMILADTFKALLSTAGVNLSRSGTLFGITGTVLLPLCLMKNLASLAPFSLLGIIGMGYTTFAMALRYLGGAYKVPNGKFVPDLAANLQPQFGTAGANAVFSSKSFVLICMLGTAFMAHFNAPKFYIELKDNTIKRYNTVVAISFAIAIAIFAGVAGLGFLTFGSASSGLILNNYSTKDSLMSLSRVAVAVSIIFSYPLAFTGARDGILDLMNVAPSERSNALLNKLTFGILAGITGLALVIKDLTFLLSIGGATLGTLLIYVYPALMFRKVIQGKGDSASKASKREVLFALFTAFVGSCMGGIGAKMAIGSL
mmetsp:Transcript_61336/g.72849  ORF Transcript_61336/g.72849 Transcript_61336/m.72849 type:complete len:507 (+) Transcript_61336:235-1755(+)